MSVFNKIYDMSLPVFILSAVTLSVYIMSLFTAISSNAQVAVSPSSYVADGNEVVVVKGPPQYLNGARVEYTNTHVIPITPSVASKDSVVIPLVPRVETKIGSGTVIKTTPHTQIKDSVVIPLTPSTNIRSGNEIPNRFCDTDKYGNCSSKLVSE